MSCRDRMCGAEDCQTCHPEHAPHPWRWDCQCEACDARTAAAEDAWEARAEARREERGR